MICEELIWCIKQKQPSQGSENVTAFTKRTICVDHTMSNKIHKYPHTHEQLLQLIFLTQSFNNPCRQNPILLVSLRHPSPAHREHPHGGGAAPTIKRLSAWHI